MKKVAMVVQRYGEEVNGGAELEARLYAERLAKHYDVTVFTTCAKDYQSWKNEYPEGEDSLNGVKILRFPNEEERELVEFGKIHRTLLEKLDRGNAHFDEAFLDKWFRMQGPYCPKLIQAIEDSKDEYSAFLFMTYLYYTTVYGVPKVAEKAILIPTAHDEPYLHIPTFQTVFRNVKAMFFNSRSEQKLVNEVFGTQKIPSAIGGCGVILPENIDMEGFRSRYTIPEEYIVYAGRVDVNKGCKELLSFLHSYNEKRKTAGKAPVPLVLIGKNAMNAEASEEVFPLGFVSDNDKYAAIKGAMFLVLPSLFESLSIAVLESFALQHPVLVNGVCATLKDHCLVSNGGLFYHDEKEFEACVDYLVSHPKEREVMGRNGEYYCFSQYDWDDIMHRLEWLIEL